MGRDFSIGCSDSTVKGVSHILFIMVKLVSQIEDGASIDDILHEDKHISIEQLAVIIQSLKNDLDSVRYNEDLKTKFVESFKYYTDDTFEVVYKNCLSAYNLFVDALVDSVLNKEKKFFGIIHKEYYMNLIQKILWYLTPCRMCKKKKKLSNILVFLFIKLNNEVYLWVQS